MPGFVDGMVDIGEPIGTIAESPADETMSTQTDIKFDLSAADTVADPGYPTRHTLYNR